MDVTYWKSERRRARTELRNYIVRNSVSIEDVYEIEIPNNLKNMPSHEFDAWIEDNKCRIFAKKREMGKSLRNPGLIDCLIEYNCACTNVQTAEVSSSYNV